MSELIGRQIEVGVGVEKVRGTAQETAEAWIKNVTANITSKAEKIIDDSKFGVLEDSQGSRVVKKWYEGDLAGVVNANPLGYYLYNLYGAVSSSLVETGVYDHTFSLAQSIQHASLTVFLKDASVNQIAISNCMLSTFEIVASVDDYLRFTANIMGAESESNSDTPSYDEENDFIARDVVIKVADTEGGLSGATALKAKDLSLSFDVGAIKDHVFGSYAPDDIYDTKMAITGEITKNYDDTTFEDLFLADTAKYMSITITGAATIGAASNPTITIVLNKVQIMDWNREGAQDELVTETIAFKAFYNETDNEASSIVLRNTNSEYDVPVSD